MSSKHVGATLCAAVLAALPGHCPAARVDYALHFAVERNDNVLITPLDPVSLTILRPAVDFHLTQDSSTWQAEITGRAEYLRYGDSRYDDSLDGTLDGRVSWTVVPRRMSFVVEDHLALRPINTLAPDVPGNRQQINVVSAGPSFLFSGPGTLRGTADLRYVDSRAEVTEEFNSSRVDLAVRTIKDLDPTSRLSANVRAQRVDFDDDVLARDYDRYDVFARYDRRLANFDIAVDAGYSSLQYRTGGDSRSDPLLRLEGGWRPTERQAFVLRLSSQFSDAATDIMGPGGADLLLAGSVAQGVPVVNASPYRERRVDVSHTFTSLRLVTVLSPYFDQLRYVDSTEFDQDGRGIGAGITWRVGTHYTVGATGVLDRIEYLNLARVDETRRYGVHVQRDLSRHWTSRLEFARYERRSSEPGIDASQNIARLSITYRNR